MEQTGTASGSRRMKKSKSLFSDNDFVLYLLVSQTNDALYNARSKELSPYKVTPIEAGIMFSIHAIGGKTTPAELARWMFRKHQTVTALLSRMERKGLIQRSKDPVKKNTWTVEITAKGHEIYQKIVKRETIHRSMSSLSAKERQQFESYLRKVREQALRAAANVTIIPFP